MKNILDLILLLVIIIGFCCLGMGCATSKQLAENLDDKAVTLSGTFSLNKIVSIDTVNKSPSVISLIGWGNYTSIPTGMEFIQYRETSDASIFNSSAKSTTIFLIFASSDKDRADKVIAALEDRIKNVQAAPAGADDN